MNDFKIGDIVRIKGGQDEWEVYSVTDGMCLCFIKEHSAGSSLHYTKEYLELVHRKEETYSDYRNRRLKEIEEAEKVFDKIAGVTYKCLKHKIFFYPGQECPHCGETPKKKVERWLWVYKGKNRPTYTSVDWNTYEEAQQHEIDYDVSIVGKDPNCKEPLVTEE